MMPAKVYVATEPFRLISYLSVLILVMLQIFCYLPSFILRNKQTMTYEQNKRLQHRNLAV